MLGPFATTSRLTPIHQMSLAVLSRAACTSMSTTTTTTTTRERGDRYGPMEWAQLWQKRAGDVFFLTHGVYWIYGVHWSVKIWQRATRWWRAGTDDASSRLGLAVVASGNQAR